MCAVACKTAKGGQGLPMQFGVGEASALEGLGRLQNLLASKAKFFSRLLVIGDVVF